MNLTFLGTSAANAFPEPFCRCANCDQARALGGPSLRKRSAALVNDDLLIDLGPDIMTAAWLHDRPLTNVRYCLQTHPHDDHLDASHFLSRSPGFGVVGAPLLHYYASPGTMRVVARDLEQNDGSFVAANMLAGKTVEHLNFQAHLIEPFEPIGVGPYRVTAFPAEHHKAVESMLYAVQRDGRSIFYGTDTAALPEEVWTAFHDLGLRFDVVVLDHTYGPNEAPDSQHMNAAHVTAHVARFRDEGLLAAGGRALATHIAHEGNPAHPELVDYAVERGYEIAYDGLVV